MAAACVEVTGAFVVVAGAWVVVTGVFVLVTGAWVMACVNTHSMRAGLDVVTQSQACWVG